MKPNVKNTLFRRDDVAETIGMRIDTDSLSHLMTVLTDLYSDPIMAIVREISTNARDSHIDAGVDRPIEVSLPTEGHRKFIVRDFGVGLSVEDIRNVFSAYGASTKRESDAVTGMLGLGCKAPLSYTNSFTVEAVKDGIKTIANVTKDESNVGSIKILDTFDTDEGNGVTVSVPVKQYDAPRFIDKARHLFSFWRGGVLVDGEEPAGLPDGDTFYIDPDVALQRYNKIIVMGGVPYEVNGGTRDRNGWIAWVEMGEVDFTPSREALHMTKRTEATIKVIEAFVAQRYAKVVQDELALAPNDWERIKKYRQIQQSSFRTISGLASFRDFTLPTDKDAWKCRVEGDGTGASWKSGGVSVYNLIDMINADYKVVTDFPFKRVSPLHKAMLQKLNPGKRQEFLVLPEGMSLAGYQDMPHTSWTTIPEIPKKQRPTVVRSAVAAPNYDWVINSRSSYTQTVKDAVPDGKVFAGLDGYSLAHMYSSILPDVYIAYMRSDRVEKFFRLYPDALNVEALDKLVKAKVKSTVKKLGEKELLKMILTGEQKDFIAKFGAKLNDPMFDPFKGALTARDDRLTALYELARNIPAHYHSKYGIPGMGSGTKLDTWTELQERYPLMFGDTWYMRQMGEEHFIEYANDRYEKHYKGV